MSNISDKLNKLKQIKDELKNVLVKHNANPTDDFTTYPSVFDKVIEDNKSGAVYGFPEFWNIKTNNGTSGAYLYGAPQNSTLNLNDYVEHFKTFTSTQYMFYYNIVCRTLTMQNCDFSKVTSMSHMFANFGYSSSSAEVTVDMSGVKTTYKLRDMNNFCYFSNIKSLNLTGIDTSYVTNMNSMFYYCDNLEEVIGEIDCSRVTNGLYPGSYTNPFSGCTKLKRINLTNIYKGFQISNVSRNSINLSQTILEDDCLISIMNQLPSLPTGYTNIVLTLPPTNTLTDEQKQIAINKNWTVVN